LIATNKKSRSVVSHSFYRRPHLPSVSLLSSLQGTDACAEQRVDSSFAPLVHSLSTPNIANRILASLPSDEQSRILTHARFIRLERNTRISEVGARIAHCYFFIDAVANIVSSFEDGRSVDVGLIGIEGMSDVSVLLGGRESLHRTVVHVPGLAIRVPVADVLNEFQCGRRFQENALHFLHALFGQITQSAACNRSHLLNRRLSRWLLDLYDRIGPRQVEMTHELLAQILGTNRSDITRAMSLLRTARVIQMSRGKLQILSREMLLQSSCECYRAVQEKEFSRSSAQVHQSSRLMQ
jgi:CRP-like cAMP-binding protein